MASLALQLQEQIPVDIFTEKEVTGLIPGTSDRRYGLVKRAIASGDLIQIRRGVYAFGKRFQRQPLNLYELAQKIYVPSYISLESALSYHGLIPEAAYTVTSTSMKRSESFETPLALFSYTSMPRFNFIGVERIKEGNSIFLMASSTKALIDYVLTHKLDIKNLSQLTESLRIESSLIEQISITLLTEIANTYGSIRAKTFLKVVRQYLNL